MQTSNSKYLLCFLCIVTTLACSLFNTPPLTSPIPFPTDTNIPMPPNSTPAASIPTAETYIPPANACDIIASEGFSEISDLYKLPNKIQAIFDYPIANRGEPFNPTDVIDPNKPLPGARFIVAGISPTYALIAVERGGIAHLVKVSLYYSALQDLHLVQTWSLPAYPLPNDLHEIKISICK